MSMLSFSCCPGGAFMMCESAAEYDPEMQMPVQEEVLTQVKQELAPQVETYCPVGVLINKLGPIYDKIYSLLNRQIDTEREGMISLIDEISATASEVADKMRICLMKQYALAVYVTENDRSCEGSWATEELRNNLGFFMKNATRIKQQGYDKVQWEERAIPQFWRWDIEHMLGLYMSANEVGLPDMPFSLENIREAMASNGNYADCFSTTIDMFNCLFKDPDRMLRLEEVRGRSMSLSELMSDLSQPFHDSYNPFTDSKRGARPFIIQYISKTLRKVKQCAYDLQCEIFDNEAHNVDEHVSCVKSMIAGTADIFFIPTIYLFSVAYRIRQEFAKREAVNAYVKGTMTIMKNIG